MNVMMPHTVIIHVLKLEGGCKLLHLTECERARAAAFKFRADAMRWSMCRSYLRKILGELLDLPPLVVPIMLTNHGKPVLEAPHDHLHFNISHCHDLALIALCGDGPVGVDVEPTSRADELIECESTFCHPAEIIELPDDPTARCQRLLEIWTAKEALLKALGTGFSHPPETVCIRIAATGPDVCAETLPSFASIPVIRKLRHPALDDHTAALSCPPSVSQIAIISPLESTNARSISNLPASDG